MENADFEDKENLPPGFKFNSKASTGTGKRVGKVLSIAERARALREKVQEKCEAWGKVNKVISDRLTTTGELDSNRKYDGKYWEMGRKNSK